MKKSTFKIGDAVFYPAAGVGRIEAIEDIFIGGEWQSCFVIRIHENQVTIKVPQVSMDRSGVRPLLSGRRLKELFSVLAGETGQRIAAGNTSEYYKSIERKINTGSCLELGEVVRDLTRQKKNGSLSFDEARLLETATHFLSTELAAIAGVPRVTACDQIRSHIG